MVPIVVDHFKLDNDLMLSGIINYIYKPQILGKAIPYQDLTIGVLKETYEGENRVSQTPDSVRSLTKAGFHVIVEQGGTMYDINPI